MQRDDMTLVREFAASRSEAAFAALVTRHLPLVHATALRCSRDASLAEEVAQSVFILLARKAASLDDKTVLTGWLYRATHYAVADVLKQQRRRQEREHEAAMQALDPDPDPAAVWESIAPVLDAALLTLRQRDRDAVLLRYFENKTLAEVGAALGVSEDAAR